MTGRTLRWTAGPAVRLYDPAQDAPAFNVVPGRLVRALVPSHWTDRGLASILRRLQALAAVSDPPQEPPMPRLGNISGGPANLAGPLCIVIRHDCVGTDAFGRKQKRGALSGWGDSGIDPKTGSPYAIDPMTGQPYSSAGGSKSGTTAAAGGVGAAANLLNTLFGVVTTGITDVKQLTAPTVTTIEPPTVQQGSWPAGSRLNQPGSWHPQAPAPAPSTIPWGWVFVGLGGLGAALATAAIVLGKR